MSQMLSDVGFKTRLKWSDIQLCINTIVHEIHATKFKPKHIVGLSRGGLIPATMLANALNVREVYVHGYHSYDDNTNTRDINSTHGVMYQDVVPDLISKDLRGRDLLLVDDLCDEGVTMLGLLQRIENKFAVRDGCRVRCATLYCKQRSKFTPLYVGEHVDNDWLVFPWEIEKHVEKPQCI